jgi:hypothetical protein
MVQNRARLKPLLAGYAALSAYADETSPSTKVDD